MQIQFQSQLQKHIADLLWEAKDQQRVSDIIKVYGNEAKVVYHMLVAAHFDQDMSTDIAEEVIKRIKV